MNHEEPTRMSDTTGSGPQFEDTLLTLLRGVVDEERVSQAARSSAAGPISSPHRSRLLKPRWTFSIAGVAALAAAAVVVGGVLPGTSSPAFALERGADGTVTLIDGNGLVSRDGVAEQLRAAGINVDKVEVPVSSSLVGDVIGVSGPTGDGFVTGAQGWQVSPSYQGTLELQVGRAGMPGEEYQLTASAFSAGEPLAAVQCPSDGRLTAAALAADPAVRATNMQWFTVSPPPGDTPAAKAAAAGPVRVTGVPDGLVSSASALTTGAVGVYVLPIAQAPQGWQPEAGPCAQRGTTPTPAPLITGN